LLFFIFIGGWAPTFITPIIDFYDCKLED